MKFVFTFLCFCVCSYAQLQLDRGVWENFNTLLNERLDCSFTECVIYVDAGNDESLRPVEQKVSYSSPNFSSVNIVGTLGEKATLSENLLRKKAMLDLFVVFPNKSKDSVKVNFVSFVHEQKNDSQRVVGAAVTIGRYIDGLPVRGESFFQLYYNEDGYLNSVDFRWKKYEKKNLRVSDYKLGFTENAKKVIESFSEKMQEHNVLGLITNVVCSLKPINYVDGRILVPSFTFYGFAQEGSEKLPIILDVPLIEDKLDEN